MIFVSLMSNWSLRCFNISLWQTNSMDPVRKSESEFKYDCDSDSDTFSLSRRELPSLPPFKRRGPFRYFDQPFDILHDVPELLLVYGQFALAGDGLI